MIDKEFLESIGVTDAEAVEKITSTYAADIQVQQKAADDLKAQLAEANKTIKSYTDMDIEGIQKSAAEWQQNAEQAEADRKAFEHRTKLQAYVRELHLKDDIYEAHVTKLVIVQNGYWATSRPNSTIYSHKCKIAVQLNKLLRFTKS